MYEMIFGKSVTQYLSSSKVQVQQDIAFDLVSHTSSRETSGYIEFRRAEHTYIHTHTHQHRYTRRLYYFFLFTQYRTNRTHKYRYI